MGNGKGKKMRYRQPHRELNCVWFYAFQQSTWFLYRRSQWVHRNELGNLEIKCKIKENWRWARLISWLLRKQSYCWALRAGPAKYGSSSSKLLCIWNERSKNWFIIPCWACGVSSKNSFYIGLTNLPEACTVGISLIYPTLLVLRSKNKIFRRIKLFSARWTPAICRESILPGGDDWSSV